MGKCEKKQSFITFIPHHPISTIVSRIKYLFTKWEMDQKMHKNSIIKPFDHDLQS